MNCNSAQARNYKLLLGKNIKASLIFIHLKTFYYMLVMYKSGCFRVCSGFQRNTIMSLLCIYQIAFHLIFHSFSAPGV